ncbi:hemagglutinin repeat-containing protein [Comamonas testosteroni]
MKSLARLFTIFFILQTLLCTPVQAEVVAMGDLKGKQPLALIHQAQNAINIIAAISGAAAGVSSDRGQQNSTTHSAVSAGTVSGTGVSYNNTTVKAGGNVSLQSAGDTTLRGATVAGNSVKADVGGNLTIESLQNKDNYNEHSSNSGFSLVIPIGAGMPGLTVSHGNINIDSNYQSTGTQSGIRAGDGGFQVNVAGDTTLKGGAITSTQKAVDEGKNSFHTGGQLVMSDLQNQAEYNASGSQITLGVGGSLGSSSAGVGRDNGSASSTTQAGISGIAGNTSARTGDKETGLKPIFDKERVSDNVDAGITVTTVLGKEGSTTIGHYADKKEGELRQQADLATDPAEKARLNQEADQWAEGGAYRTALHTALGGITGGASGAAGAAGSATVIPIIGEQVANLNLPKPVADAIVQGVAVAVGATAGGTDGVVTSVNGTVNNYLSKSPYREVRSRVNKESARLIEECSSSCTWQQMQAIDQQMAQLDRAGTLVEVANHSRLTTEQALQLGNMVAALLPLYGTPIALYQAISGESLTGQDLGAAERFFNGLAAVLPMGALLIEL